MNRKWNGKKIGMPAIYAGIPIDAYHGDLCIEPSISSSGLRKIANKSPAHYWVDCPYNPKCAEEKKATEAMTLGRAAHHLLLGEAAFKSSFIRRPEMVQGEKWQGGRLACKAWLAAQAKAGLTVLTIGQVEQIRGMALALAAHPLIKAGLLNGYIERSFVWKDEETGVWMKARPDAVPNDSGDLADLKTTSSVDYLELQRAIATYGYHQQGALVREGWQKLSKQKMNSFSLVFIESDLPHCVRVVSLKDNDLDRGERQNRAATRLFADCLEKKHWPGPGGDQEDAHFIEMPEWRQKQIDDRLQYLIS